MHLNPFSFNAMQICNSNHNYNRYLDKNKWSIFAFERSILIQNQAMLNKRYHWICVFVSSKFWFPSIGKDRFRVNHKIISGYDSSGIQIDLTHWWVDGFTKVSHLSNWPKLEYRNIEICLFHHNDLFSLKKFNIYL